MATVYKAYDTRLETDVAVKVIRTENLAPSVLERSLKRFEREAKSLAKLGHPNIVKVMDYGEYEGKPYLVMPYLPGGTLKQKLGKPIAWRATVRFLLPIAHALEYAHKQNIIHRDVKPANILLTEKGQPMLSDFGVAKLFDMEETTNLTGTGMGVDTPEYMAPEQWLGQVTPQTDIYALGVVFYEMITGRRPYTADTPAALLLKQANDPLPRPSGFVAGLPDAVERVLLKALAKRTEDRYPEMLTFVNALEGLTDPKGATVTMTGIVTGTKTILDDVGKVPPAKSRVDKSRGGWVPWAAGVGILIACCAAVIVGVVVWPWPPATPTMVSTSSPAVVSQIPPTDLPIIPLLTLDITPTLFVVTPPTISPTVPPTIPPVIPLTVPPPTVPPSDVAALVLIPAGEFMMGSNRNNDEKPSHSVYLDDFWIDQYEVTNDMFTKFVSATGYKTDAERSGKGRIWVGLDYKNVSGADWQHPAGSASSIAGLENHPVVQVSWNDAAAYCSWAGRRLPTEAEWEKAARGDSVSDFPWGSEFKCQFGNYDDELNIDSTLIGYAGCDSFPRTSPVGSFPSGKSPYGVYDMSGNVWEWVADWYSATYYSESPYNNPTGPASGTNKVARGGSWFSAMKYLYVTYRDGENNSPTRSDDITGFRCAHSVP
jgi:serine/threonine-protein kinase